MEAQQQHATQARQGRLQPVGHVSRPLALNGSSEQVVTLCVGGTLYSTTRGTLTAVAGSYLAILFGDDSDWQPTSVLPGSQTPFIDRDGELFRFVLAYLRTVKHCQHQQPLLLLPDNPMQLQQLRAEADFYVLPGLATLCSLGRGGAQQGVWGKVAALQQQLQRQLSPSNILQQPDHQQLLSQYSRSSDTPEPEGVQEAAVISSADVQLGLTAQLPSSSSLSLAAAVLQAQHVLAGQQQAWMEDTLLQQYADIVLRHLVQLPLAAQQPDLIAALANAAAGSKLEFRFAYYPVGDVRVEIRCRVVPPNADQAIAVAAAAAAAGAGAAANSPSPDVSPRDSRQQVQHARRSTISGEILSSDGALQHGVSSSGMDGRRACSGSLSPEAAGVAAVAAAAAAAAAVNSYAGAAVMPGPGWGSVTMYHRYTIKETSNKFVLTTHAPGEAQEVQEVQHAAFKPDMKRYSALHKLCVQQCPRSSVAGLVWLLEQAGFSSVQLSTSLETYYVGRNVFTGFTSIIICGL